jgi:hypothetical protein
VSSIRAWRQGRVSREPPVNTGVPAEWKAELEHVAERLAVLSPSSRDPSRFAIERSDLVRSLRQLARRGEP